MYITLQDGVRLFVDTRGSALDVAADTADISKQPEIVLLHGGPGMDHMVFRPCFDLLAEHAHVFYLDQRGCGRSDDGPSDCWTLDQWADDVAEAIAILGLKQPILLGTSFGGFVAQRFAARHPNTAGGMVLMSTGCRADIPLTLDSLEQRGGSHARAAASNFFSDAAAPGVTETYFDACLKLYTFGDVNPIAIERVRQRPNVMLNFFRKGGAFCETDLRSDLKKSTTPTLILHGLEDPVFPVYLAKEMRTILESGRDRDRDTESKLRAHLVCLPECGHLSEQDNPDRIVSEIISFFQL